VSPKIGGTFRLRPRELHSDSVYTKRSGVNNAALGGLTSELSGRRRLAGGCPLERRVSHRPSTSHTLHARTLL
jgi:hypothetical protein